MTRAQLVEHMTRLKRREHTLYLAIARLTDLAEATRCEREEVVEQLRRLNRKPPTK